MVFIHIILFISKDIVDKYGNKYRQGCDASQITTNEPKQTNCNAQTISNVPVTTNIYGIGDIPHNYAAPNDDINMCATEDAPLNNTGTNYDINTYATDDLLLNAAPNETHSAFKVIITNQENLAKRIINLEKGLQGINSQLFNLASWIKNNPNSRPQSAMSAFSSTSNMSSTSVDIPSAPVVAFKLIDDENDLVAFETAIENESYRLKMVDHFVKLLGVKSLLADQQLNEAIKPKRSVALQLERKIFTESFWSKTAWTGGRKLESPRKFAFAAHVIFMGFFNDTLHQLCGAQMSEIEMSDFIKSRTRNSGYVRCTARLPAARFRSRKQKLPLENETTLDEPTLEASPTDDQVLVQQPEVASQHPA